MQALLIIELMNNLLKNIQTYFGLYPTSRNHFHLKIRDYYNTISNGRIPEDLINSLICEITEFEYDSYRRLWAISPKSKKRYSKYKIEGIEHPNIHYEVFYFFKERASSLYKSYCQIIFQMDEEQFSLFEKKKQEYYGMF